MNYKTINYLKDDKSIETYLINDDIWLSQKDMGELFGVNRTTISRTVKEMEVFDANLEEIFSKMHERCAKMHVVNSNIKMVVLIQKQSLK